MKSVLFYLDQLGVRGTGKAVYEYAHYNETLLGNKSVVVYSSWSGETDPGVVRKFQNRFPVEVIQDSRDLIAIVKKWQIDVAYYQKAGNNDGLLCEGVPNVIHAVFGQDLRERHGTVYAYISRWLSKRYSQGQIPFVPYICPPAISPTENWREKWRIPDNAVVFGRHGGYETFNYEGAREIIKELSEGRAETKDGRPIYFLFINTPEFCSSDRVKYLPATSDPMEIANFIHACDGMIHARMDGETFGLAVAEFITSRKPVLAYGRCKDRAHLELMGLNRIVFNNRKQLRHQILHFHKPRFWWPCGYLDCRPEKVMPEFARVFLN